MKMKIQISVKLVPKSPIDNKSALVQVMAWRQTGDKPIPEPMMTHYTDTYMQHRERWNILNVRYVHHVLHSFKLVLP